MTSTRLARDIYADSTESVYTSLTALRAVQKLGLLDAMPPGTKFLVVGLGNVPYPLTRHSIGHLIVVALAKRYQAYMIRDKSVNGQVGVGPGGQVHFFKTFSAMNVSGPSVALLTRRMSIPENVIVIHDSIEHKPLTFAPRFGGSHNGHNGVRNIIAALRNNKDFHRFRIGVGKPNQDAAEYVMGEMSPEEHKFWTEGDGLEQVKAELDRILNGQMH